MWSVFHVLCHIASALSPILLHCMAVAHARDWETRLSQQNSEQANTGKQRPAGLELIAAPQSYWVTRPKNVIETDTETFFETKIFETETDTLKKLRKVSIPRSLETRCHTLLQNGYHNPLKGQSTLQIFAGYMESTFCDDRLWIYTASMIWGLIDVALVFGCLHVNWIHGVFCSLVVEQYWLGDILGVILYS